MTCLKVGAKNMWTQILAYHFWDWPLGAPEEARVQGLLRFGSLFRYTTGLTKGLTAPSRSPEKPEPDVEPHMLMCTAERSAPAGVRAGLKLGLGQILLLSKNTTVQGCVLLWWLHLADWLQCNQYLLVTATLGGHNLWCSWLVIILSQSS